jgi:hypothetical protein
VWPVNANDGLVTDRGMTLEVLWAFGFVDEGDGEVIGGDAACSVRGYQELVCPGVETAGSFAGLSSRGSRAGRGPTLRDGPARPSRIPRERCVHV